MSDPLRWSDGGGDLSASEQRLLDAGLGLSVPPNARRAVWGALGTKLPLVAGGALGTAVASSAKAVTTLVLLKQAGIGIVLGTSTMLAVTVVQRGLDPEPARPAVLAPAAAVPSLAPPESVPPPPSAHPSEPVPAAAPPPPAPSRDEASPPALGAPVSISPPGESQAAFPELAPDVTAAARRVLESQRLGSARARLRRGDNLGALEELDVLARDMPNGVLAQEREALAVEALLALGQASAARARATLFLSRYPGSPHARAVRRALE